MSYIVTVDLWGPVTGCELLVDAPREETYALTRERVHERLCQCLPEAEVVWAGLRRDERLEREAWRQGRRLTVTINLAVERDSLDETYIHWLRVWIEAQVAEAMLELLNPMRVDDVSVLRPWEFF